MGSIQSFDITLVIIRAIGTCIHTLGKVPATVTLTCR
jgi:hypothetical protein